MRLWLRAFTLVCKHRSHECWEGQARQIFHSSGPGLLKCYRFVRHKVSKLPTWLTATVRCFKNTGLWSGGQRTAGGPDNLIPSLCLTRLPNPFCSTSRVCFRVRRDRCNRKPVTQSRTLNASHTCYWKACEWNNTVYVVQSHHVSSRTTLGGFTGKEDKPDKLAWPCPSHCRAVVRFWGRHVHNNYCLQHHICK